MAERRAVETRTESPSTRRALGFVYVGYTFRYLYLLVLIPFYGRVLGAAAYGQLTAAMALFQVVWALTEFGFVPVGARAIAIANETQRAELYGRHVAARCSMAALAVLVGIAGTLTSPPLRDAPLLGVFATLSGVLSGFNLGWFFQGTLRFRTSVVLEIVGFAINLPLVLALVRGPADTWIVMCSLSFASLICAGAAHVIALRMLPRRHIRFAGVGALIREAAPLFINRGVAVLTGSASTYLVSLFATAEQLGWYGAAERLISAGLSLLQPANGVLVGTLSRYIGGERADVDRAFAIIRKAFLGLTALGIAMVCGTELLGGVIVPLILGPSFAPAVPMVKVMVALIPLAAVNQVVTDYVLIPFRFERFVPIVSGISSALNLTLIALLGRAFGSMGVAWARVLGECVVLVLLLVALRKSQLGARIIAT